MKAAATDYFLKPEGPTLTPDQVIGLAKFKEEQRIFLLKVIKSWEKKELEKVKLKQKHPISGLVLKNNWWRM